MELTLVKSLVDMGYREVLCDQLKLSHKYVKMGIDSVAQFMYSGTLRHHFKETAGRGVALQIYGRKFPVFARNNWLYDGAEVYVGKIQPSHDFVIFDGKKALVSNSIRDQLEEREGFLSSDCQRLREFEREFSELVRSAKQITRIRKDLDPLIKFLNKQE